MRRTLFPVLNVLGFVIALFAFSMLLPLIYGFFTVDAAQIAYDKAFAATFLTGVVLNLATRRYKRELQPRDGFLLVALVWSVLPVFACMPLMLHLPNLSFTDAYFEAMSGLTTTGATVLSGLDDMPASINMWRSLLVWIGGMGILVMAVAILPLLGFGGSQLFKAETPGPMKDTKLTPRITETAKGLYLVYVGISVLCFLCYRMAGMSWLDALIHMFSTMGLGGFSSHDASYAFFNSRAIESVTVFFMLVASINFAMHFLAWKKKSLGVYRGCAELNCLLLVVMIAVLLVMQNLLSTGTYFEVSTAFRFALFNTVSIATTTGFSNTDYNLWPAFSPVFMLLLCCFCTAAGSTGGGIKMIRAILLFKQALRELVRTLHPRAVNPVRVADSSVENRVIFGVLAFMLLYGTTIIVVTMLLLFSGLEPISAFSATIACINNTGPGLNQVGPATTFAGLTDFQTWVCTVTMLLGRLELFPVLVLLTPTFWRN